MSPQKNSANESFDHLREWAPTYSIVVPAYNVENYLAEALDSIVSQSIGFLDNVEIIVVDDGSPDSSGEIADGYASRYPRNIKVIHQANQGVSGARNRGIQAAAGRYIGFLDPDDYYENNALEEVDKFFKANPGSVEVAVIPIKYFEARTGDHQLNIKFADGTRIIDTESEWDLHQASVMNGFFERRAVLDSGILLDKRLKYAEDSKFATQIIMRRKRYGVVATTHLNYRKRAEGGSALDNDTKDFEYYSPVLEYFAKALFEEYRGEDGTIPKYVQQVVCYDLQWRIKQRSQRVLRDFEEKDYRRRIEELARDIDPEVILKQRHIFIDHKLYLLGLSRGKAALPDLKLVGNNVKLDGRKVWGAWPDAFKCVLDSVVLENGELIFRGVFRGLPIPEIKTGFVVDKNFYEARFKQLPENRLPQFLGTTLLEPRSFIWKINVGEIDRIRPAVSIGGKIYTTEFIFKKNSRMLNASSSYKVMGGYILQNVQNQYLTVRRATRRNILRREISVLKQLISGDLGTAINFKRASLVGYRVGAVALRIFRGKPSVVLADRLTEGGDNGEALFRLWPKDQAEHKVKLTYLCSKQSSDYKRLKKLGRVLDPTGVRGRLAILSADVFASSHIDEHVINPFGADWPRMADTYRYDLVFLQHGVTFHDISNWINAFEKPVTRFITTSPFERQALLGGGYGFVEREVPTTGFARHDRLSAESKSRKVVIAPTWRKELAGELDPDTLERTYNPEFKSSEYFNFYQSVLSDKRLLKALEFYGYDLDFVIHPALGKQVNDFESVGPVNVVKPPYSYPTLVSEAAMFITDFSSVIFDAAYLRRRIAYAHFDSILTGEHIAKTGYFDYQTDGFGPVVNTAQDLVDEIIAAVSTDCAVEDQYEKRMNRFFAFSDEMNSQRIAREISTIIDERRA